jgi:hypothetical protein
MRHGCSLQSAEMDLLPTDTSIPKIHKRASWHYVADPACLFRGATVAVTYRYHLPLGASSGP